MGEVVSIDSQKPHLSGPAICTHCKHEWQAVAPVGNHTNLQCPECGLHHGIVGAPVVPPEWWECRCGGELFYLTRQGAQCRACGIISQGWVDG